MGSLPVVVGTGCIPYAAVSGKPFQNYTESFSGYAKQKVLWCLRT